MSFEEVNNTKKLSFEQRKNNFYSEIENLLVGGMDINMEIDKANERLGEGKVYGSSKIRDEIISAYLDKTGYRVPISRLNPEEYEKYEQIKKDLYNKVVKFRNKDSKQSMANYGEEGTSFAEHSLVD
jgi:hypothetical protein